MTESAVRIFPLGDNALTIELGNRISEELNRKALHLAEYFGENRFRGFVEAVPAYASTTIFYDFRSVRQFYPEFESAFAAVRAFANDALAHLKDNQEPVQRLIEIPVTFDKDAALDLDEIASKHELQPQEVIDIFTGREYRVFMIGFLPGFAYMGEVDERIATPRKESPRLKVPKGSVGIAGSQTGIYSLESPGGWQIIGRTDIELFTPYAESPCLLRSGDHVRFLRIPDR